MKEFLIELIMSCLKIDNIQVAERIRIHGEIYMYAKNIFE